MNKSIVGPFYYYKVNSVTGLIVETDEIGNILRNWYNDEPFYYGCKFENLENYLQTIPYQLKCKYDLGTTLKERELKYMTGYYGEYEGKLYNVFKKHITYYNAFIELAFDAYKDL